MSDIAPALADTGEQVVVITSHPNHPTGRFYPEVKSLMPSYHAEGKLGVWRLPTYPCRSKSKLGRLTSYVSFCISAFICSLFVARNCTVAFVYQTPFTSALSVLWLKWIQGTRLAYVVVDLWPESFAATGVAPQAILMKLMYKYSKAINRAADHIFASTQGTRDRFIRDGFPTEKVTFTPVWVEGIPINYREVHQPTLKYEFTTIYAGNLGPAQRLDTMLLAARTLLDDPTFVFHIYGSGSAEQSLRNTKEALGLTNVIFHGLVTPAEAFDRSRGADAAIMHLVNSPDFKHTIPSKVVSILAAGSILLCGVPGETSRLVEEWGAGLLFESQNPDDLVRALREAKSMTLEHRIAMRIRAWALYDQVFEKKRILAEYLTITQSLSHS